MAGDNIIKHIFHCNESINQKREEKSGGASLGAGGIMELRNDLTLTLDMNNPIIHSAIRTNQITAGAGLRSISGFTFLIILFFSKATFSILFSDLTAFFEIRNRRIRFSSDCGFIHFNHHAVNFLIIITKHARYFGNTAAFKLALFSFRLSLGLWNYNFFSGFSYGIDYFFNLAPDKPLADTA